MGVVAAQSINTMPKVFRVVGTMAPLWKIGSSVDERQGHRKIEADQDILTSCCEAQKPAKNIGPGPAWLRRKQGRGTVRSNRRHGNAFGTFRLGTGPIDTSKMRKMSHGQCLADRAGKRKGQAHRTRPFHHSFFSAYFLAAGFGAAGLRAAGAFGLGGLA